MAGHSEEQLDVETATAEPSECSRWAVTCLVGCVGAALFFVAVSLPCDYENRESLLYFLGFLLLMAGLLSFALSIAFVVERFDGGIPRGGMSVDVRIPLRCL